MEDLRKLVESLGLAEVSTYIQTGNVLFTSKEKDSERLEDLLEKGIQLRFKTRYPVKVFALTPAQLKKAGAHNPFDPERLDQEQRCHLMFLSRKPDALNIKALLAMQGKEYRFAIQDKVFYFAYDRKFEGPKRRNINFEKVLGVVGTARSWTVVKKLIELTAD